MIKWWSSDQYYKQTSKKIQKIHILRQIRFQNLRKVNTPNQSKEHYMWDSVIFLKSTHLVHPCKPHPGSTPMENSVASWGVRYTRLTSTGVENVERGRSIILINGFGFSNSPWVVRSIFQNHVELFVQFFKITLSCSFNFLKSRWVVRRQHLGWILVVLDNFLKSHVSRLRLHVASPLWK